jgi:hypothetical protein
MRKAKTKGISIPIAFNTTYRKKTYDEVEVYFSFTPIKSGGVDLLEPGKVLSKKINCFLNKNRAGSFEFLIPYKVTEIKHYEAPHGMKYHIGLVDENPTTATLSDRVGMIACNKNNLNTFLDAFYNPDFYIAVRDNKLFLRIKSEKGYVEIPSQDYSPNCWRGFAHPSITLEGSESPMDYNKLDWSKILSEICQPEEVVIA